MIFYRPGMARKVFPNRSFKIGNTLNLLKVVGESIPMLNSSEKEGAIGIPVYSRNKNIMWATPGTVAVNVTQSAKIQFKA